MVSSDDFCAYRITTLCRQYVYYPAGIFAGANVTWSQFFFNMIPVFLGNVTGGAAFVGASYLYAYRHLLKEDYCI